MKAMKQLKKQDLNLVWIALAISLVSMLVYSAVLVAVVLS